MSDKLTGSIEIGQRFIWEPQNLHAKEYITVTRIVEIENDERRIWARTDSDGQEYWNEESRFREACVREEHPMTDTTHDDLVQAAVAAALTEAAGEMLAYAFSVNLQAASPSEIAETLTEMERIILALITPDAQSALDRMLAAERDRCAKEARAWAWPFEPHGHPDLGYDAVRIASKIAAAIRKGGE